MTEEPVFVLPLRQSIAIMRGLIRNVGVPYRIRHARADHDSEREG